MSEQAARHYRQLAARNAEATQRMREQDAKRVAELRRRLAESEALVARADTDEQLAGASVLTHWETATEAMWPERWLKVGPIPDPVHPAPPVSIRTCDAEVRRTHELLLTTLRKPGRLPWNRKDEDL
jgi:hypothetical protein